MNKLEFINFKKSFGSNNLFNNINLTLNEGHVYGIVGPNGCGKSVLLKCICGLLSPSKGSIKYNDKLITANSIAKMNVGASIEKPMFIEDLTGIQNLMFLASFNNKVSKSEIEEWLKVFDLYVYKDKKVKEYSLGTKQKLGIIQAIMEDQNLILLDEVTNSLDNTTKQTLYKIVKQLKEQGKIIIYVNHSSDEIKLLCNYVYRIENEDLILCENY